jgi:hypothetical protein
MKGIQKLPIDEAALGETSCNFNSSTREKTPESGF